MLLDKLPRDILYDLCLVPVKTRRVDGLLYFGGAHCRHRLRRICQLEKFYGRGPCHIVLSAKAYNARDKHLERIAPDLLTDLGYIRRAKALVLLPEYLDYGGDVCGFHGGDDNRFGRGTKRRLRGFFVGWVALFNPT